MYENFYGFAEKPFSLTPDPKYLYRSQSHANAFELLQYAIRRREGFVVVTGDIGTGKTTLCRALLEQIVGRMGTPARSLLREKGTPFGELGLSDPNLTDDQLLDAMMAHPILINRPIVVTPLGVKLCRPSETVLAILPATQRGEFRKEDGQLVVDAAGRPATTA